jgi:hypothetical protein|tara:strand:- start:14740 stop:14967 length:228 start_codon:yes stop_codon:yes gene_type:complete
MSELKLVYDISSLPNGSSVEQIISIYKDHNVVFYDSLLGKEPKIFSDTEEEIEVEMIDMKGKELKSSPVKSTKKK